MSCPEEGALNFASPDCTIRDHAQDAAPVNILRPFGLLGPTSVCDGIDIQAASTREGLLLHRDQDQGRKDCLLLCSAPACPSVIGALSLQLFQVQSGGAFDVDYEVTGPNGKYILEGQRERQGDFVFTANEPGEYKFCFNNEMSTFAEKFVDFEISVSSPDSRQRLALLTWYSHLQVENEARVNLPSKQGTSPEQTSALEESLFKISGQLSTITRNQKYFRTRENRNFSTVRSTEKRIVNFTFIQIALIVAMGALQVFIVRFFFQGARKGYV